MTDPVIDRLIEWGKARADVRAVILTSSRAAPGACIDAFSDYDVILAVADLAPFRANKSWLSDFGPVLVVYHDPLRTPFGGSCFREITQYENGLKIDFDLWEVGVLTRVAASAQLPEDLDLGYEVLLDKGQLTDGMRPPCYQAFIPRPPTNAEYQTRVEEFFQEGTYVAKHLWRGDLMAAKYNLDHAMKLLNLYPMLVWRFELDHNWSIRPGDIGKGLRKHLAPSVWSRLEATYAGADPGENWEALFKTVDLFREVATEVADRFGFVYPANLDSRCVTYFGRVKILDRNASDLATIAIDKKG